MAIHATPQWSRQMFGGLFRMPSHVCSVGRIILLGPGSFWGVTSEAQHWAMWSNGYQHIF